MHPRRHCERSRTPARALHSNQSRVLLLDNYDSYSTNLVHLVAKVHGREPLVLPNDAYPTWEQMRSALPAFGAVVIGPGPGHPSCAADFGLCRDSYQSGLPVLGVCLGHQGLAHAFGGDVVRGEPAHGLVSEVEHDGTGLFDGLPSPLRVTRYHSLHVSKRSMPAPLRVTAACVDDGVVMALAHDSMPLHGVQFHPESVCSEYGEQMIANFLRLAALSRAGNDGDDDGADVTRESAVANAVPAAATAARPPPPPPPRRHLLVREIDHHRRLDAARVFASLYGAAPLSFWIDARAPSPAAPPGQARFSYMGCGGGPHSSLLSWRADGLAEVMSSGGSAHRTADFAAALRSLLAEWSDAAPTRGLPEALEFRGGLVGVLGYESWAWLGPAASAPELQAVHDRRVPSDALGYVSRLLFADRLLAIDHRSDKIFLLGLCDEGTRGSVASAERWMSRTARAIRRIAAAGAAAATDSAASAAACSAAAGDTNEIARFACARGEAAYLSDIGRIQQCLAAGDSYEVCPTTQIRCTSHAPPPLALYKSLCALNPAPHAAYLRLDPHRLCSGLPACLPAASDSLPLSDAADRLLPSAAGARPSSAFEGARSLGPGGIAVCSSSPERFLRVAASGLVECKPIKGTAPRGATADSDRVAAQRLETAPKERSENLMIVDLIRNDISRVCAVGSVVVPSLMAVESFASVHQLVSTVRGQLRPSLDAFDAVGAAFPPGSMTGAPKVRTMRIIDELERGVPRGVYSGALGFFSTHGAADLSVVIRTATFDERGVSLGAGGAVTVLSDAHDEWREVNRSSMAVAVMRARMHQGRIEITCSLPTDCM